MYKSITCAAYSSVRARAQLFEAALKLTVMDMARPQPTSPVQLILTHVFVMITQCKLCILACLCVQHESGSFVRVLDTQSLSAPCILWAVDANTSVDV
jgi:hypothetical protein